MDANQAKAVAAKNNNKLIAGGVVAAVLGYYWYKKRQGDVANIGDAVSLVEFRGHPHKQMCMQGGSGVLTS